MTLKELIPILKKHKKAKKLIIFVGSGMSMDSGLPSWSGFTKNILDFCENIYKRYEKIPTINKKQLENFKDAIESAKKEIHEHPVWITSILKNHLMEFQRLGPINVIDQFYRKVMYPFIDKDPNKNHFDIVSCDFPYIITSNYDDLLEKAASDLNIIKYEFSSFDFTEPQKIASTIYQGIPSIIHIHGLASINNRDFEKLILTKNDYQKIKKDKPAMAQILRTLFIKYNVLFVGFGSEDPHINDVMEEITYFFNSDNDKLLLPNYYLIWHSQKGSSNIQSKYAKLSRTEFIDINNFNDYHTLFSELKKV